MASMGLAAVPEAAKLIFHTAAKRNGNKVTGVVLSAGLAEKTAKVRVGGEEWNKKVRKVRYGLPPAMSLQLLLSHQAAWQID